MSSLQESLQDLELLDRCRVRSAELRDLGSSLLSKEAESRDRGTFPRERGGTEFPTILLAVHQAHVEQKQGAECHPAPNHAAALEILKKLEQSPKLLAQLGTQTTEGGVWHEDKKANERDVPLEVPLLGAARTLQALSQGPTFSPTSLKLYYHLVRELYSPDPETGTIGSARAGVHGDVSAFVTAECTRALVLFAQTLDNTGTFLEKLPLNALIKPKRSDQTPPSKELESWITAWRDTDELRERVDGGITRRSFRRRLALSLGDGPFGFAALKKGIASVVDSFDEIVPPLDDVRYRLTRDSQWHAMLGHQIAYEVLTDGQKRSKRALEIAKRLKKLEKAKKRVGPRRLKDAERSLDELAGLFKIAAQRIRGTLRPVIWFSASVLDRELVAAAAGEPWDVSELAFSALTYGHSTGRWDDHRLSEACRILSDSISRRGLFPESRGFHRQTLGYVLQVANSELVRAFSELLQRVEDSPVEPRTVQRLMVFFEETRVPFKRSFDSSGNAGPDDDRLGWSYERGLHKHAEHWSTALAVLALGRLNRMLDVRINAAVYEHFEVEKPEVNRTLPLNSLLYGDYGLCLNEENRESIAITLLRMRAHLLNVGLENEGEKFDPRCVHSIVLHGPPGTGKTTLIEALAKSSEVPLVRISPSDIVLRGAEGLEGRTRAVFKALAFLTRSVVLFDEFDQVVKDRTAGPQTLTHFSFLTPGLLPRLKALNDRAKRRKVAFALATNYIGDLDEAAIRSGRFDQKVGIFHPDPLSRAGYLWRAWTGSVVNRRDGVGEQFDQRFLKVLRQTANVSVSELAKQGWLLAQNQEADGKPLGSAIEYLALATATPVWLEGQKEKKAARTKPQNELEEQEAKVLEWLRDWDNRLRCAGDQLPMFLRPESSLDGPGTETGRQVGWLRL